MNTQWQYNYIFAQHIPDLDAVISIMLPPHVSMKNTHILNSALGSVYYGEPMSIIVPGRTFMVTMDQLGLFYRDHCTFEITYTATIDNNNNKKRSFNKLIDREEEIVIEASIVDRKKWLDASIPYWIQTAPNNSNIHKEVYLYMNNEWGIGRELDPRKTLTWKANHDYPINVRNRNLHDRAIPASLV